MIRLRHERPVVADGSFRRLHAGSDAIFAFERKLDGEVLIIIANLSSEVHTVRFDEGIGEPWRGGELILTNLENANYLAETFAPWEARVERRHSSDLMRTRLFNAYASRSIQATEVFK